MKKLFFAFFILISGLEAAEQLPSNLIDKTEKKIKKTKYLKKLKAYLNSEKQEELSAKIANSQLSDSQKVALVEILEQLPSKAEPSENPL